MLPTPPGPKETTIGPPVTFTRRRMLVGAGALAAAGVVAGGAASGLLSSGASTATPPSKPSSAGGSGILVLVTLYGGNDGLNTVIPYADSTYHAARPTLGYSPSQALPLADGLGLNPQLKGLKSLWDAGHLAVVRGVGYPDPSLSHFQSMDIWQTATPTGDGQIGWLGGWLDATASQDPLRAISIGATLPTALRGANQAAAALSGTSIQLPGGAGMTSLFGLLGRPGADRPGLLGDVAAASSDLLTVRTELDGLSLAAAPAGPATTLADQLGLVAQLIKSGAPGRVYQVSLATFDTHVNEKANHERLLGELDAAVSSFFTAIQGSPHGAKVVLMTYSEFGRRVAENAGGGTDHGAAAPLFVVGQAVKGRAFYGEEPSLTVLDNTANLRFNVDFRSVYATVLEQVLGVESKEALGGSFPTLALL